MNWKLFLALAVVWCGAILYVNLKEIHGASATGVWLVAIVLTLGLCATCTKSSHEQGSDNSSDDSF